MGPRFRCVFLTVGCYTKATLDKEGMGGAKVSDYFLTEKLMDQRVHEEHHRAELRRLAREARMAHPSWASRQRCKLLCRLGLALVSLGRQLLAASAAQARSTAEPTIAR